MNTERRQYLENLRIVRRPLEGRGWFIANAAGWNVRGPFSRRELAEVALKNIWRRAEQDPED